jgi:hypothetical protein
MTIASNIYIFSYFSRASTEVKFQVSSYKSDLSALVSCKLSVVL